MQIKLTQDYGVLRQSLPIDRQAAPEQAPRAPAPPRRTVLPAERTVEGELLRNSSRNSNILDDLLHRSRFAHDSVSNHVTRPAAQRAIDTYRGYAAGGAAAGGGSARRIDYYA